MGADSALNHPQMGDSISGKEAKPAGTSAAQGGYFGLK
jgi:hypothetical protein